MAEIFTTRGFMDESLLEKRETSYETELEIQAAQEYYFDGEMVRRDVQLHLKRGLFAEPGIAHF